MASAPLAARLSEVAGPLFFRVTACGTDGTVGLDVLRALGKAGVRLQGLDAGEVRTPLTEPPTAHAEDHIEIIASGRALLAEGASEGEQA